MGNIFIWFPPCDNGIWDSALPKENLLSTAEMQLKKIKLHPTPIKYFPVCPYQWSTEMYLKAQESFA